jgi:hypothetical protein
MCDRCVHYSQIALFYCPHCGSGNGEYVLCDEYNISTCLKKEIYYFNDIDHFYNLVVDIKYIKTNGFPAIIIIFKNNTFDAICANNIETFLTGQNLDFLIGQHITIVYSDSYLGGNYFEMEILDEYNNDYLLLYGKSYENDVDVRTGLIIGG